jgi:hypothetical protein
MFSSKPINRHYLFTISCEGKIVNLENLLTQFLFDLKRNAKQARDTRGVTTLEVLQFRVVPHRYI